MHVVVCSMCKKVEPGGGEERPLIEAIRPRTGAMLPSILAGSNQLLNDQLINAIHQWQNGFIYLFFLLLNF